jgi:hypothetical protein
VPVPKLTFLAFGRNDEGGEAKRMRLFVESVLAQSVEEIGLWVWDASEPDKAFKLPNDDRIIVHREPVPIGELWNPTYYRNFGALQVQSEFIVHVNTDCVYGPDTAKHIIAALTKDNKLIQCRRKPTNRDQFDGIDSLEGACKLANKIKKTETQDVCGDLQGVRRQHFINIGGYHGLIKGGEATRGDYVDLSKGEDTQLKRKFTNKNVTWIQNKTFVLHLWHPRRENADHRAKLWKEKHAGKKRAKPKSKPKPRGRPHSKRKR